MKRELELCVDVLQDGRRLILQRLGQLPPQARCWSPGKGQWSSVEVMHHLALVEDLTLQALVSSETRPPDPIRARDRLGALVVRGIFRFGLRVRTPTRRVRPDATLPAPEVEALWEENRAALLQYLRSVDPSHYHDPAMCHPVAGPMTLVGTVEFLVRHQAHHLGQLKRLTAHPNFPWNAQ